MILLCIALFATSTATEPTQRACFNVDDIAPFVTDNTHDDVVTWWERGTYVVQLEYTLPR